MDELEIMREQLAVMKQRLDTQQIINARLMRNVMRGKAMWLNKLVNVEIVLLPFLYLFFVAFCALLDISQWYSFAYLVLSAIDVYFDRRTIRIPAKMFGDSSILDLKKYLLRQKRERFIQVCVATPAVVVWLVLLLMEMLGKTVSMGSGSNIGYAEGIGGLIGGVVGALIGIGVMIIIYRKMQRTNDELLRDINNLESDEDNA